MKLRLELNLSCLCFIVTIFFSVCPRGEAATLSVPSSYSTIQSAIDAAKPGDTVQVASGTYNENITLRDGVNVQGSGMDTCALRGDGSTSTVFANQIAQRVVLSGFTITGGRGFTVPWSDNRTMGGGFFADRSEISIQDNRIISNTAQIGGGIALMNSRFSFTGNTIQDNRATLENVRSINMGGGIYLYDSQGEITGNTISQNTVSCGSQDPALVDSAGNMAPGAGICIVFSRNTGDITIRNNTINGNIATGAQHYGGGIYCYQVNNTLTNTVSISGNVISNNESLDGGGIAAVQCSADITGNTFTRNAAHWGGGIYGWMAQGAINKNRFMNNRAYNIRNNKYVAGGGGIACDDGYSPTITGNTFTDNTATDYGGGLEIFDVGASPLVQENVFTGNTARFGGGMVISKATPQVVRNYLKGNRAISQSGGGIFIETSPAGFVVSNNIIVENSAGMFGGGVSVVNGGMPDFTYNTVAGNTAGEWGGGVHSFSSTFSVTYNIITINTKYGIASDTSNVTHSNNNAFGNTPSDYFQLTPGAGSISVDPRFNNTEEYRPESGSPSAGMGAYAGPRAGNIPMPGQAQEDPYEGDQGDDTAAGASVVVPDAEPRQHNFHKPGDEDWSKFYGLAGQNYVVLAAGLGSEANPVIAIYASDGVTLLAGNGGARTSRKAGRSHENTPVARQTDRNVSFTPTEDDVYFVKVRNEDPEASGEGTDYSLQVSSGAAIVSTVQGIVSDASSGMPLRDVRIKTNGNRSALSLPTGDYVMPHPAGTFTLVAESAGYQTYTDALVLSESETIIRNISLVPAFGSSCSLGGSLSDTVVVEGSIDTVKCPLFTLLLNQEPSTGSGGYLYVGLKVPSVAAWANYMWFRPADDKTPPFIQVVKDEAGFIAGAGGFYYSHGAPATNDLKFDIGGLSGFKGENVVFETWFLREGLEFNESNIERIQSVDVNFQ